jgi:hypothetical protein
MYLFVSTIFTAPKMRCGIQEGPNKLVGGVNGGVSSSVHFFVIDASETQREVLALEIHLQMG